VAGVVRVGLVVMIGFAGILRRVRCVSKPWTEMLEAHRSSVRATILGAVSALVSERGPYAPTMAQIAEAAGVTLATVHTCFADVESIMRAWHDRQATNHLGYLDDVGDQPGDPLQRLGAVLRAYAAIVHQTHDQRTSELGVFLHDDEHLGHARRHLHETIRYLIAEGARVGHIRDDVASDELAGYCLRTIDAIGGQPSATIRQSMSAIMTEIRRPQPNDPTRQRLVGWRPMPSANGNRRPATDPHQVGGEHRHRQT
jgi:AcrR family transcriptional regulator